MTEKVTWIFAFMIAYWGYCVFWGIQGAARARTACDHFIAGRRLPGPIFIVAATATCYSGWAFLGHAGLIYRDGLQYAYVSFAPITIALPGILFLKRQWILGKRFGFITPGEMLAYYFESDLIRLLVVVVAMFFSVPYVGLQLLASGFLFSVLTDGLVGVEFGMWVLAIVVLSYVAVGGLRAVAYADALQCVLMALGIVIIGVVTLFFVGGWDRLMAGIAALSQADPVHTPDGYSHYIAVPGIIQLVPDGALAVGGAWTAAMILTYLLAVMGIQASPAFSMWAFASRTPAPFAAQQVWASSFGFGLLLIVFVAIQGVGGHFLGADRVFLETHPELVNPVMVDGLGGRDILDAPGRQDLLVPLIINLLADPAPWLVGLLAVCALAAMESTASCYMATAGGMIARDLFKNFLMPAADDRTQKFVGRLGILVIVILALVVATTSTDALVLVGGLAVSYGFQMVPALIGVCYWPFLTRQGVALGLVGGLITVTLTDSVGLLWPDLLPWGRWPLTIHSAGWGVLVNVGVAILVSLVTQDDWDRKKMIHAVLREHAALRPDRRRLVPVAWGLTILWFVLAIGPGVVVGNTTFGTPNDPETWWLGMPSIWIWQILMWALGVGLMWFLAYRMGLSTTPEHSIQPLAEDIAEIDTIRLQQPAEKVTIARP
jgi:solute:Na+ symporter, SSS family